MSNENNEELEVKYEADGTPIIPGYVGPFDNLDFDVDDRDAIASVIRQGPKGMTTFGLNDALREEYRELFRDCRIRPDKRPMVAAIAKALVRNKARYESVSKPTGVPWYVIAVIHNMECGMSFRKHLHNGDLLTGRTIHVPAGFPKTGKPPFTWEFSATDALRYDRLDVWKDWTVAGIMWKLESYNGMGYRRRSVPSPYLWSYSTHYVSGKYVADGVWSSTAVSKQAGAATILHFMRYEKMISIPDPR